jgi:hypothetical protein
MATPTIKATNIYAYQNQVLGQRTLLAVASDGSGVSSIGNTVLYWDVNGNPQTIFTPSLLASGIRAVDSRDYMFFTDGVSGDLQKWNIATGLSSWGFLPPLTGITVGAPIPAGNITILSGRVYFVAFYNATTQSYSDLSPASATTGPLTAQNIPLSTIPVSTNPAVTNKILLATADGGDPTTLYQLATLANATTTFTDNIAETTLVASNVWQDTDSTGILHGLFGNQPPPNGSFPLSHNGRLWMAIGEVLYFSKNLAEMTTSSGIIAGRYEESWTPTNQINVATGAEQIRGLLTDGQTLYIGTEQHIFRLTGDSPQNFSQPQIIFPATGLMTQNVWQLVYIESTPVGTMWMTPDYRVMGSDFNTYQDVGTPIQPILNSINPAAINAAWAVMVSNGPYNFYVLGIPTGSHTIPDTFCAFDMRLRKWFIWQYVDQFISGIFYTSLSGVIRWIFVDSNGIIRLIDPTTVLDRSGDVNATPIISTLTTAWLDYGDSLMRKTLNEIEVVTTDPNMLVTIQGASSNAEFLAPTSTLVNGAPLINSQFGGGIGYKVYLAGTQAIDRHYRKTFVSTSSAASLPNDNILSEYSVEAIPIHRF